MNSEFDDQIRMIPVNEINILNPRDRGKKKFSQIVANIGKLGLKKPITVALSESGPGKFDLACGQGRLEAFISLGAEEIPAILTKATKGRLMLMSLAENIARRQHSTLELLREISDLKEAGYSHTEIAAKIDVTPAYVRSILQLLAKGEVRLLQAVEKGQIPVSIAITIATSDDKGVQRALTEAYEQNQLRGRSLMRARELIETRRSRGKGIHRGRRVENSTPVSAGDLLKTYQQETLRQKMIVQKAKIFENRLLFSTSALKQLFKDENFATLLRAEGLTSLPQYLSTQILGKEAAL